MSRLAHGRGAPLSATTLVLTAEVDDLAIDEGEIAARMSTSMRVEGRTAVVVWLSSGAVFVWSKSEARSGSKGYPDVY